MSCYEISNSLVLLLNFALTLRLGQISLVIIISKSNTSIIQNELDTDNDGSVINDPVWPAPPLFAAPPAFPLAVCCEFN